MAVHMWDYVLFIMKNHHHFQFHRAGSCIIVLDVELVAM